MVLTGTAAPVLHIAKGCLDELLEPLLVTVVATAGTCRIGRSLAFQAALNVHKGRTATNL